MLNHIVMFRRRRDVAENPVLENALTQRMVALGPLIETVRSWSFQPNISRRPVSWDYVLESSVANEADLQNYLMHPLHVALVADLKPYFELAVVDYAE